MTNWMVAFEQDELPPFNERTVAHDASALLADVYSLASVLDIQLAAERAGALSTGGPTAEFGDKFRKWLERLVSMVRAIAKGAEAASYTITVGTGVSVSVTFSGR